MLLVQQATLKNGVSRSCAHMSGGDASLGFVPETALAFGTKKADLSVDSHAWAADDRSTQCQDAMTALAMGTRDAEQRD